MCNLPRSDHFWNVFSAQDRFMGLTAKTRLVMAGHGCSGPPLANHWPTTGQPLVNQIISGAVLGRGWRRESGGSKMVCPPRAASGVWPLRGRGHRRCVADIVTASVIRAPPRHHFRHHRYRRCCRHAATRCHLLSWSGHRCCRHRDSTILCCRRYSHHTAASSTIADAVAAAAVAS